MKYILVYLVVINAFSFALIGIDKRKAKKNKRRIPEKTLFLSAIFGGSVGSIAGMQVFQHKTKHISFAIGMPIILVVQLALGYLLVFKL